MIVLCIFVQPDFVRWLISQCFARQCKQALSYVLVIIKVIENKILLDTTNYLTWIRHENTKCKMNNQMEQMFCKADISVHCLGITFPVLESIRGNILYLTKKSSLQSTANNKVTAVDYCTRK